MNEIQYQEVFGCTKCRELATETVEAVPILFFWGCIPPITNRQIDTTYPGAIGRGPTNHEARGRVHLLQLLEPFSLFQ
jgi:hypothetical protein